MQSIAQVLEAAKLPADFTAQVKKYVCNSIRIIISPNTLCIILTFGKDDNYIPSKAYYEKLEAITPINAGLLALKEYKAFLPDAISAL